MQVGSLSRNAVIGLILFIQAALIGAFFYWIYMPSSDAMKQLETEIQEKQRKVREVETTKRALADLRVEIDKLNLDISRLEKFFSEDIYIPTTLQLLENLSKATNMELISIKPAADKQATSRPNPATPGGAKAPAPGSATASVAVKPGVPGAPGAPGAKPKKTFNSDQEFRTTIVDVALIGDFKSLNEFLSELSWFPKLVVVNKLEVSRANSAGEKGTKVVSPEEASKLQIKLPMTFYIQKKQSLVGNEEENKKNNAQGAKPVVQ